MRELDNDFIDALDELGIVWRENKRLGTAGTVRSFLRKIGNFIVVMALMILFIAILILMPERKQR